jgi:hypothetical protein
VQKECCRHGIDGELARKRSLQFKLIFLIDAYDFEARSLREFRGSNDEQLE